MGDILPGLPPALKARLFAAFGLEILWNKPGQQVTVFVEITENTLQAIPGITDPGQDGYHDTSTETSTDDTAPMWDLRNTPRSGRDPHSCGKGAASAAGLGTPAGRGGRVCRVWVMFAATAARIDADDPLSGLELGERPEPAAPDGWATVTVKAAALNHHDVWTLRGVGISADRLPIVLGCDAAGIDADGNEVVVHAVIGDPDAGGGDETLDPRRSLLSERYDGVFAERVCVPRRNLVPKPSALSFEEAACLPTAYLTAYKMLFEKSGVQPGATLLVQGAGGGVATALIVLGRAAGYRVWATSRSEAKRERALKLGADQVFPVGARLPERVDVVLETVGQATWAHSVRSLKPGGRIVISGATSGDAPPAELTRVFFTQLTVTGSTMGSRDQLGRLARFCEQTGARPVIDRVLPLAQARDGFEAMITGDLFGKIVFNP